MSKIDTMLKDLEFKVTAQEKVIDRISEKVQAHDLSFARIEKLPDQFDRLDTETREMHATVTGLVVEVSSVKMISNRVLDILEKKEEAEIKLTQERQLVEAKEKEEKRKISYIITTFLINKKGWPLVVFVIVSFVLLVLYLSGGLEPIVKVIKEIGIFNLK